MSHPAVEAASDMGEDWAAAAAAQPVVSGLVMDLQHPVPPQQGGDTGQRLHRSNFKNWNRLLPSHTTLTFTYEKN